MNPVSQYTLLEGSNSRLLQGNNPPPPNRNGGGGEPLSTASGIALSGGYIYNSLAAGNLDAIDNEAVNLDVCLGHPTVSESSTITSGALASRKMRDTGTIPQLQLFAERAVSARRRPANSLVPQVLTRQRIGTK